MSKPASKRNKRDEIDQETEERDDAIIGTALRWSLAVIVALLIIGGAVAYLATRPEPPPEVVESEVKLPKIRSRPKANAPIMKFTNVSFSAGIDFDHENGAYGDKLLPETMGGGCAFIDFDQDNDQDIVLVNSTRWPWDTRPDENSATMRAYENDGLGKFTDVTSQVGLDLSFYGMGIAVGDSDNDGDSDIFISAVGPDHLLRNDDGHFVDITDSAGVSGEDDAWGTSCGWFDYNNDGLLDLFVCHYIRWSKEIDAGQDFQLTGVGRAYGPPTAFEGTFPSLFRNDGNGKFTDVSAESGIQIKNPATGVPMAKSMGLAPIDIDRDGWMDLFVANDTVQNFLFHNQQDGTFIEMGAVAGVGFDATGDARGAMGIDTARFRNDETLGVAIGNFANEMTSLYCASDQPMQFVDAAIPTGLGPATRLELTFGLFFFDSDLDGRLDLLAANGHLEEEINKVQVSQQYAQPPQLFWNCGPNKATEFLKVGPEQCGDDFFERMVGRGASFADIDGDGDLDVLLMEVGGKARLLRNDQDLGNHWIRIKLEGRTCNRDAIGAWLDIRAGDLILRRQIMPTRSYLSQSELPLTVGLGAANRVDRIVIHWPDGTSQEVTELGIDETVEIIQAQD